jgi:DNA replication protein DnaC
MVNMVNTSSTERQETRGKKQEDTCPICGGLGYVRADVPVDHPNFGKLVPCTCHLAKLAEQRVYRLRSLSNLNLLSHMTFESFIPKVPGLPPEKQTNLHWAYEEAKAFCQNPDGWLVFKGGYGCGKTHLAAAIANACVERGQPVLFITVPDLLDHLRAAFAPSSIAGYDARFEEVRTAPVLILDDLGTESSTPWVQEKLFQVFNYRYNARLPTVITTNHELEEIALRLRSRLVDPVRESYPRKRKRTLNRRSHTPAPLPRNQRDGSYSPVLTAVAKPTWPPPSPITTRPRDARSSLSSCLTCWTTYGPPSTRRAASVSTSGSRRCAARRSWSSTTWAPSQPHRGYARSCTRSLITVTTHVAPP